MPKNFTLAARAAILPPNFGNVPSRCLNTSFLNFYILKRFLLPLAFLVPKLSEAQTSNTPAVAVQSEIMPVNTPYHAHSLMFGMKTSTGDQYLIGPAFKSFMGDVGHKRSYAGLKIHTHVMIGRFAPFLSYEMMWGKYYIYGGEGAVPETGERCIGCRIRSYGPGTIIRRDISPGL